MTNYPTHFKLKSRKTSFLKNIHFNRQIVLKILAENGSDTVMCHAKFRNNLTTEQQVIVNLVSLGEHHLYGFCKWCDVMILVNPMMDQSLFIDCGGINCLSFSITVVY